MFAVCIPSAPHHLNCVGNNQSSLPFSEHMLLLPLRFALAAHPLYAACSFTQLPSNVNAWITAPATENCNAAFIASGTTCNASCATNYIGDGYSFVCCLGAW